MYTSRTRAQHTSFMSKCLQVFVSKCMILHAANVYLKGQLLRADR